MQAIVAVTENWGVGKDNQLLVHLPADMKHFREKTKDAVLLMGRATLESFPGGRPLKGRVNIVLTKQPDYQVEGATVVHSIQALHSAAAAYDPERVFVIGGASVYAALLPYCQAVYVTKFAVRPEADRFFPNLDQMPQWVAEPLAPAQEENGIGYQFFLYKNQAL